MTTPTVANPGKHGVTSTELERQIRVITASDRPIVVGPWLAEVGFEVLYWIPFLRWLAERFSLPADRLTAVSRGGVSSWYAGLCDRYVDVLDLFSSEGFRARAETQRRASHTRKQVSIGDFDARVLESLRRRTEYRSIDVLHPSFMYGSFRSFWLGKEPFSSAVDRLRFRRFQRPEHAATEGSLPNGRFTTAKFYYRQSFPESAGNERLARECLRAAGGSAAVVLLNTGIQLDDHREMEIGRESGVSTLSGLCSANDNLAAQSVAISRSSLFIGTYGGAAYLAGVYGVPALAMWSDPSKINPTHLEVGRIAGEALGAPLAAVSMQDLDLLGLVKPAGPVSSPTGGVGAGGSDDG